MKKNVLCLILVISTLFTLSCNLENNLFSSTVCEHTKESYVILQAATCAASGIKEYTCSKCNKTFTEEYTVSEYPADEIHEMTKKSVGEIVTYDKSGNEYCLGSCFVLDADGKIVTNYHVIDNAYSAKITLNEITYNVESVLAYDKTIDIAVLKIDGAQLSALPICKENHAVGKTVYAFGSSRGLTSTFSQGIITYSNREIDGVTYVQHDAAISSGNSGGPLINPYGEVIGINTWTVRDSQNLNFAISTLELNNLIYDDPLTVREFYEKECDPFKKLKDYAIQYGSYDASDRDYILSLGVDYSSDYSYKYTRALLYEIASDSVLLSILINSTYLVTITIDEVDGIYDWYYYDDDGYYMGGILYASTYDSNTLLGYNRNNIYNASLRTSTRELASVMVSLLCTYMDEDLADVGISAEDLGFIYY